MPKSQVRKKKVYTPPTDIRPAATAASKKPSPVWVPITAVTLIVVGIAWLVVYYLSGQAVSGGGLAVLEPRGRLRLHGGLARHPVALALARAARFVRVV